MMGSQYNSSDEEVISGVEVEITETESDSYYDTESDFNKVINEEIDKEGLLKVNELIG